MPGGLMRTRYAIGSPEKQMEAGAPPIIYEGNMDPNARNQQAGLPSMEAQGGRIGFQPGGDVSDRAEMYYKYLQEMKLMNIEPVSVEEFNKMLDAMREKSAQGGRIGYQTG